MPARAVVTQATRQIARPLKVLIPIIQGELQQGNAAGVEHYRRAGEALIEAKGQVGHGGWGRWLSKNFELSTRQAQEYMRLARVTQMRAGSAHSYASLSEARGATERARDQYQSKQHEQLRRVLRDVARDEFVQERQARDDEVQLHRDLAEELIGLGYRALATKLHPDRGGSKEAMERLNRVRDELKTVAQTRRFV